MFVLDGTLLQTQEQIFCQICLAIKVAYHSLINNPSFDNMTFRKRFIIASTKIL